MLRLSTRTPIEYERGLSSLMRIESKEGKEIAPIAFLDSRSVLTRFLRTQPEYAPFFQRIHTHSIEDTEGMLHLLRSKPFHEQLSHHRFLVVSPYYHLLDHHSAFAQKQIIYRIENALEKIEEKYDTHVVVAEE